MPDTSEVYIKLNGRQQKDYDAIVIGSKQAPGLDIHEMGGCSHGEDSKKSLLNEWNHLHHCKDVFVTDGACMTSTGSQSPSMLYMAFTARAVNYTAEQMKKRKFIKSNHCNYEACNSLRLCIDDHYCFSFPAKNLL